MVMKRFNVNQTIDYIEASHNVSVKDYHCDNGMSETNIFKKEIARSNQIIFLWCKRTPLKW